MGRVLIWLIRVYQSISRAFLPKACRFYPSCSEYACDAIHRYGAVRGGALAVQRLLKCHPFNKGGLDPVR